MRPGVLKMLTGRHTAMIAATQPELAGKRDLVAFAYTDHSAAQRYAERNRERFGHVVVGPIQPGKGGSWVNVIVLDGYAARHRRGSDDQGRGGQGDVRTG